MDSAIAQLLPEYAPGIIWRELADSRLQCLPRAAAAYLDALLPDYRRRTHDVGVYAIDCAIFLAKTRHHSEINAVLQCDAIALHDASDCYVKAVGDYVLLHTRQHLHVLRPGPQWWITPPQLITSYACFVPSRVYGRYIIADTVLQLMPDGTLQRMPALVRAMQHEEEYTLPCGLLVGVNYLTHFAGNQVATPIASRYHNDYKPVTCDATMQLGPASARMWLIAATRPYHMPTPLGGCLYVPPQRYMIG